MNKNSENVAAGVMLGPDSMNREAVTGGLLSHFIISAGAKWGVTPGRFPGATSAEEGPWVP